MDENIIRKFAKELLQAMIALNQSGFTHRDIKPENVMLDQNWKLKLIDFDHAGDLIGELTNGKDKRLIGSHGYICPELTIDKSYYGYQ
jgi:serine/threonine protein kinase